MNKKWMCGLAALGLFTSLAFAQTKAISNFGASSDEGRKLALGEYWAAYTVKSGASDNSTAIGNEEDAYGYVVLVEENSEWVAALENYVLGPSTPMDGYDAYPQAAIGLNVGTGYNLSGCTGFRYQFKGAKHIFKAELSTVTPDAGHAHYKVVNTQSNWTTETVQNTEMAQESWVPQQTPFNSGSIAKFAFEVGTKPDVPGSETSGNLYVKDFQCIGTYTEPSEPPVDPCIANPTLPQCGSPIMLPNGTVVSGLNVAHFARSLHIASGKDATVSLFDMHGKQVFSKKVLAGERVVSLENQRQGVYYAVVRSGSLKQTVKVVLK